MIEQTELIDADPPRIELRRAAAPGTVHLLRRLRHRARRDVAAQGRAHRLARDRHAGGLRARRKSTWCGGRRSRCSRPAMNWSRSASRSRRRGVYDSNGAIIAAAVTRSRRRAGAPSAHFPDDEAALEAAPCASALEVRHGGAVRRHVEGRGRSLAPRRVAARQARRPGARRRAEARQAALPRGRRTASRSSCCRAFRPRRSSRSTLSSRR